MLAAIPGVTAGIAAVVSRQQVKAVAVTPPSVEAASEKNLLKVRSEHFRLHISKNKNKQSGL